MWNPRKSRAALALVAAAALGACDMEKDGPTGVTADAPQLAAIDTTTLKDTTRTFVQVERLANPLAMELFVDKREHGAHDAFPPFRDPDHFTDDYVGFITRVAGRDEPFARAIAAAFLGTSRNPGDKIAIFPNRQSGFTAANLEGGNPRVGFLSHVLFPGEGFGGRTINEDVVDTGLSALFGTALLPNATAPGLSTDNVSETNPPILDRFPYFPAPNPASAINPGFGTVFRANLTPLNGTRVVGTARFTLDDDGNFLATVSAVDIAPNRVHQQFLLQQSRCPADANKDGRITFDEVGEPLLRLDSDLSSQPAGTFPVANDEGKIIYGAGAPFATVRGTLGGREFNFTERSVILFGAFTLNGRVVSGSTEGATFDPSIPVACGQVGPDEFPA